MFSFRDASEVLGEDVTITMCWKFCNGSLTLAYLWGWDGPGQELTRPGYSCLLLQNKQSNWMFEGFAFDFSQLHDAIG